MFNERISRSFETDVYIVVTSEYTLKPVGERHFHLTPWHFPSSIHMGYTQVKMATSIFYHCSMRKELFLLCPIQRTILPQRSWGNTVSALFAHHEEQRSHARDGSRRPLYA